MTWPALTTSLPFSRLAGDDTQATGAISVFKAHLQAGADEWPIDDPVATISSSPLAHLSTAIYNFKRGENI